MSWKAFPAFSQPLAFSSAPINQVRKSSYISLSHRCVCSWAYLSMRASQTNHKHTYPRPQQPYAPRTCQISLTSRWRRSRKENTQPVCVLPVYKATHHRVCDLRPILTRFSWSTFSSVLCVYIYLFCSFLCLWGAVFAASHFVCRNRSAKRNKYEVSWHQGGYIHHMFFCSRRGRQRDRHFYECIVIVACNMLMPTHQLYFHCLHSFLPHDWMELSKGWNLQTKVAW